MRRDSTLIEAQRGKRLLELFSAWLCAATMIAWQGCATTGIEEPTAYEEEAEPPPALYEWNPYGLEGAPRVVIDLTRQRAVIFIGGRLAGWTVVATGREGYGTPSGDYRILEKLAHKRSSLYGKIIDADGNVVVSDADVREDVPPPGGAFVGAPMPYWMRLTWGGVGMHAGYIPRPGRPASHGCIRLPPEVAEALFKIVKIGTPVRIVY